MKKSIFTLVILLLGFNCLLAQLSGNGTANDPWQISSTADLSTLSANSTYWGGHIKQTADIDAPSGSFSPIGSFTGSYDGGGHTIDGLYIAGSANNCGLFRINNGNIIDLGVINVNISGRYRYYVGGLVGTNFGTVSNCYSTGSVIGGTYVGGLVGLNKSGGEITECYSTGSVNGKYSGGLVGFNIGTVSNCYSTGSVNGKYCIGGLVGYNVGFGTVSNCYSTGSVNGNTLIGGLIGRNLNATVSNSFWDTQTSGRSTSAGGSGAMGRTTTEMQTQSTFTSVGWDFIDIWVMYGYPVFVWVVSPPVVDLGDDITVCEGKTVTLDAGNPECTYLWSTSETTQTIDVTTTDNYSVTVTNEFGSTSDDINVTFNPLPDANAGDDAIIYIGYPPYSTQLNATGGVSYSWSPTEGLSDPNIADPIAQPEVSTTYTVTVTDANGCSATDEITVNVIDVRCGKNNNKVLVCHKGNTICISPNAVQTHLNNHGDYLGNCGDQLVTLPTEYELHTNYPNPFNPTTRIDYSLPFDSKVNIQIFDVLGREVVTLVNDNQRAGYYTVDFNASNLTSGIYYYRMSAGDFTAIKKMVVIK